MEIIRGKIPCAKKVVVYGPEGIGKSTFASHFPEPVFIDTEGSTNSMDVARLPKASSWQMLLDQIDYIRAHTELCRTLVIDTIDWAEQMCVESVCARHRKSGIEDFGYGNGYVYVKEEFGRFLNRLSEVVEKGIHVVLTAHAQIRKFEQPDELGAYDRWELKLGKKTQSQTSPLVKEWADMLLFANYKIVSVSVDDKGKKHKAQGGSRVMFTSHHPCWDAKNRYGLPDEAAFEYGVIAPVIENFAVKTEQAPETEAVRREEAARTEYPAVAQKDAAPATEKNEGKSVMPANGDHGKQMSLPLDNGFSPQDPRIPRTLLDLMEHYHVDEWDIQAVCEAKGYIPAGTPLYQYDDVNPGFVEGVLIGAWEQVFAAIKEMKEKEAIPFH